MSEIYLGLVHYPVYNKNMQVVTTAVTNFDIHDIARSCATYAVKRYYVIHPSQTQKEIITKILDYWQEGYGQEYNPDRSEALATVRLFENIQSTVDDIKNISGQQPLVVTTDAREYANTISYAALREKITDNRPLLLLFGTGWGIESSLMAQFDYILEPIRGAGMYNHLCVRSAAAIILDRLLGEQWWDSCQRNLIL